MGNEIIKRREAKIEGGEKDTNQDPNFVKELLALHDKYMAVVNDQFAGNSLLQKALKEVCLCTTTVQVWMLGCCLFEKIINLVEGSRCWTTVGVLLQCGCVRVHFKHVGEIRLLVFVMRCLVWFSVDVQVVPCFFLTPPDLLNAKA